MEIRTVVFICIEFLLVVLYLFTWGAAYSCTAKKQTLAEQSRPLNPWWVFDKNLLQPEDRHLQKQGLILLVLIYAVGGIFLWLRH